MQTTEVTTTRLVHLVTLQCKDAQHADRCLAALRDYGRPDALAYGCAAYDFGLALGSEDKVLLVERWHDWTALDRLLGEKVVPALPLYNELLAQPFDPARDTLRIAMSI